MATRTARLPVFAVSLATLRFGLFANWWACCPNRAFVYALLKREAYYVFTTYNADTGSVTGSSWYTTSAPFVPTGMAQSSTNLYVANQQGSIAKGGNLYFIKSIVTKAPYALARWVG
jgi:hypothetical protein